MARRTCDVLVIGGGIAGLTAAIHLADTGKDVVVLHKAFDPMDLNTAHAQGGIVWWGEDDSEQLLATDIEEAGDGIGSLRAIQILSHEGPILVENFLIKRLGVPFDSDREGHIHLTLEAAHSKARIVHVRDQTGAAIQKALLREARAHTNITFLAGRTAVDLISTTHHSRKRGSAYVHTKILGAYVLNQETQEVETILAPHTVVATGGIGSFYKYTSNPEGARGDGIAMAARAGAHVINMEYVQFHPTALRKNGAPTFLISEAMRGEGGVLLNDAGERFMRRYRPDLMELAPRDEVALSI